MSGKRPGRPQISVRGSTYDALRAYCRQHGTQLRVVVDDLILKAIDEASKEEK